MNVYGAFFDFTFHVGTMQHTSLLDSYESNETMTLKEILATSDDSAVGFFVEVDITYTSSLHETQNDLPLAPEKILIQKS